VCLTEIIPASLRSPISLSLSLAASIASIKFYRSRTCRIAVSITTLYQSQFIVE
jgi:hypothetical protein